MNIGITPINFTGGQRIKVKIANNMEDYQRGFSMGSTLPKDKLDIELRKYSSNPKFASLVQGILDGLDSLTDAAKRMGKLEKGNKLKSLHVEVLITLFLHKPAHALSLTADHKTDGPFQVKLIHNGSPHIGTDKPKPLLFQRFNGLCQIGHLRHRRIVQSSCGCSCHRRRQSHSPVFGDNYSMGPRQIGSADDRAQIMRILDIVQKK